MRSLAITVGLAMLVVCSAIIPSPTAPPTSYPTAAPTMAPTATMGRCCGANATNGAPFCKITSEEECGVVETPSPTAIETPAPSPPAPRRFGELFHARRDLGGDTWDSALTCSSSCAPLGGETANGGQANLTVNISTAGFADDEGIELGPKAVASLPTPAAGALILAFSLTHFKGLDVLPGGALAAGKYILVEVQSNDPLFTEDQAIVVYRLDESTGDLVLAADDCDDSVPANLFTAVPANGGVPSWTVAICHLSDFGVALANADDADDKDDKKPAKTTKGKKAAKPTKASKPAKSVPKADPKKPSKSAKDTKAKAKDAKAAKDKKTKIAVGAGVGAAAVAIGALGGVIAWRKRSTAAKAKKPQREVVTTVSV